MDTIMIIDDRWNIDRSETYMSILEPHFKIVPIEHGKDIFVKIQEENEIDLYLVDIVLEKWNDLSELTDPPRPLELLPVLRKIGTQKPIILISNEYENLVRSNRLTSLMNNIIEENYNITGFIVWKDFEKASLRLQKEPEAFISVIQKIKLEILKYKKRNTIEIQKKATVGIIAALEEELTPFLNRCPPNSLIEEQINNYKIYRGTLKTKNNQEIKFVAARQDRMGMVDSSYLGATLINKYEISHLFMIGVCGGRKKGNVNIGDIIIPSDSVAYQNGKLSEKGFIPDTGIASSNSPIKIRLSNDYNTLTLRELYQEYDRMHINKHSVSLGIIRMPNVKYDEMACGDIIVDKQSFVDKIARLSAKRKLCSVDMESYAVLRACHIFPLKITTTVIKSVMDDASDKTDDFKPYAAFMSAGFLYRILIDEMYLVNGE